MSFGSVSKLVGATVVAVGLSLVTMTSAWAGGVISKGQFTGASDHITTGGVTIIETDSGVVVVLGSDFSLDGAPDPKVGFGNDGQYVEATKLGHLRNDKGLQVYAVPAGLDASKYNEVYIWCEKFSVPLGVASVK
ncbi:MAG: DM13 domain-containing protein [Pseudomonadota bacterium]